MAIRADIALVILLVFALFGEDLLGALHVELDSFRIAGGLMLFWIAFEMVFEKRTQRREGERRKSPPHLRSRTSRSSWRSPCWPAPGAIAAIMLLMNEANSIEESLVVLGALAAALAITMVALIAAGPIMRLFDDKVEAAITRVLVVRMRHRRPARRLPRLTRVPGTSPVSPASHPGATGE